MSNQTKINNKRYIASLITYFGRRASTTILYKFDTVTITNASPTKNQEFEFNFFLVFSYLSSLNTDTDERLDP